MTEHEAFVRLSCTLTGMTESEIPAMVEQRDPTGAPVKLYEMYFERLRAAYPVEFRELLDAWSAVVSAAPDEDGREAALSARLAQKGEAGDRLRVAARQVIKIWYLSVIDRPAVPLAKDGKSQTQVGGDLGHYEHSAIWKLIGAPVPGYSYFHHGYWKHKPELAARK